MGILDALLAQLQDSPIGGFLQQKAAAADQGGADESGFAAAYPGSASATAPVPFVDQIAGLLRGGGSFAAPHQASPSAPPALAGAAPPLPAPTTIGSTPTDGAGVPFALAPPPAQPSPAALPPNAAPAQGQAPAAMAPPAQQGQQPPLPYAPPASPGFGDRLGAGLAGLANAGSPMQALGNLVGGLATGQRQDPTGMAMQMQRGGAEATFKSLVASGASPQEALAAVYNPEILKTVSAKYFQPKLQPVEIGTDAMGHAVRGTFNATTGEYRDLAGNPIDANKAGVTGVNNTPASYDENGRDEAFMKSLDPTTQAAVKGIVEGRVPASGRNMQQLLPLAARYENGFTAQDYTTRLATAKDFASGNAAKQVKSANQSIMHAEHAESLIDKLGNSKYPWLNPLSQAYKDATGDEKFQAVRSDFRNTINALGGELTKAFRGNSGALADIEHWRQGLSETDSPAALRAGIQSAMKLLNGSIESLSDQYNRGMKSSREPIELLAPRNRETFNRLMAGASPSATNGAPSPGASPSGTASNLPAPPPGFQVVQP